MDKEELVDKLAYTVAESLAGVGGVKGDTGLYTWPSPIFAPAEGEIYLASYFLPTLYQDLVTLEEKGYSVKRIAELLKGPSRIAQLTWPIFAIDLTDLTKDERIDLAYKIVRLISEYREDPFCADHRNILWSTERVSRTLEKTSFITLDELDKPDEYRKEIGKLSGVGWLLCEMLYTSIHGAGHEFHGPYKLGDARTLVVKTYYDLAPEFWPFVQGLPFNEITILGIYRAVDVVFDFFNRTRSTRPLTPHLEQVSIEVDGQATDSALGDIQEVSRQVEQVLRKGVSEIQKLSKKELMGKFFESYYFTIKPLREELGQDWRPPRSLYEDLANDRREEVVNETLASFKGLEEMSIEEFIKVISDVFNPRIEAH